jgi:uncharacterized protein (TIRG00374 family)
MSWLFGISLVATVVLVVRDRAEERAFVRLAENARPAWLVVAILLQAGTYAAEAGVWKVVAALAGHRAPLRSFVGLAFAKLFIDQAIPSGGWSGTLLVVRALEARGVPRSHALAGVIVDLAGYYLAYLAALATAVAIFAAHWTLHVAILLPVLFFALFAAVMISVPRILSRNPRAIEWLGRIRPFRRFADLLAASDRAMLRNGRLTLACFLCEGTIFFLDGATVWTALRAVGAAASLPAVFAAYMLAALARTMGIVPGGLGTFEAVSVAGLRLVGVPLGGALAATLLFRGLSFWLALVPGMVFARRVSRRTPSSSGLEG